jgi:lactate permease
VLLVLLPGLLLFQLQQHAGAIDQLARGLGRLSPRPALQALLIILGGAPFVESATGFGVGTIVAIPVLATLGLPPARAALLGLFGQLAVPWGALAVGVTLGADLTGLDPRLAGARTALLTAPLPALYGLLTLWLLGGGAALRRWWVAALIGGTALAAGEWLFSLTVGVELAGVLAGGLTLALLALWARLARPAASRADLSDRPPLLGALSPYLLLTGLLLLSRLAPPLRAWLQTTAVLNLPALGLRLPLLYTPGFWVLLAALAALPPLRHHGDAVRSAVRATWRGFLPGAIAIASFLAAAQVMRASGMLTTLGTAAATLGGGYIWLAPWLAALGGWLTGSNTGSNAMFALLHAETVARAGLPLDWLMGAQNGAASHATMASPARVVLAAAAAGLTNGEGALTRRLLPVVLAAIAVITLLLAAVSAL